MNAFTMVARHGMSKDAITGFTLISSDYQTLQLSSEDLAKAVAQKKLTVNNMQYAGNTWKSTNGSMDNYTFINTATNMVEGVPRAVILDRVEKNNVLQGYAVFTQQGTIVNMSVADAVQLANNKLLSNGKIRHTDKGDIVSAIGGNYPLRQLASIDDAPKGKTTVEIMFFGKAMVEPQPVEYFGAFVSCSSATNMTKLNDSLSIENAAVVGAIVNSVGQKARKSLAVTRMGATSIYGIFKLKNLGQLIEQGAEVKAKGKVIPVSVVKYATDDSAEVVDESVINLTKDGTPAKKDTADDESLNAEARSYASKISQALQRIKVK